jgi:Carboxypeptidase regulatory-like domain
MQHFRRLFCCLVLTLISTALFAQQTGTIGGKVTASDKSALPGVTVEARANVLPQPRVTTTDGNGAYILQALVPGKYTVTYTLSGMQTVTRQAEVQLRQNTAVDVTLGVAGVSENITVTAEATLVNKESTSISNGLSSQQIRELPINQDYRDLQKLAPGVMVTQDVTRGPSAGASGQDNVYMFDGVNITMPLFGVLNVDPNTHDIAQVTYLRGGAKAVDFDRAGGLLIDTVSKSGTNKISGEGGFEIRSHNFVADQTGTQNLTFDEDRTWSTINLGGPILADKLFFYGSYYRPIAKRDNQANLYGELPDFERKRNEQFGKITWTPTQAWLINASYRHAHVVETSGSAFSSVAQPTTGDGSETYLKIGTFESSWVINPKSFAGFKYTDYRNPGFGTADFVSSAVPNFTVGTHLDISNLGTQGRVVPLPTPIGATNPTQSAFVQPFVNQYGYRCPDDAAARGLSCVPGQLTGGGTVGFAQFARNDDSFYRKGGQLGYNYTLGTTISHDLHFGVQHYNDSEDRFQVSNGWGLISVPAGVGAAGTCPANACGTAKAGTVFFIAAVSQQGARGVPVIHSEFHSNNIEINDTIHWNNWAFNVGVLDSQDTLYGQGLAAADNYAGFIASPGTKYKMHVFPFSQMVQPRLGATWTYNGRDTVYASYARYEPAANSDARAASWDRNLVAQVNAYFDQNGNLFASAPNAASSGKWWQSGIKHPEINEYMIGTAKQLTNRWSGRFYTRYRKGGHFIEDTNNTARSDFNSPAGVPKDPYIPDLCNTSLATCGPNTIRGAVGSGSTYVIANLDGAFTKFYEATAESEWRSGNTTLSGSYTWSHYYGTFDQDYTATCPTCNDAAVFIGSSNLGDGPGRQLWDMKYGDLRGDRRNLVKLNGTYTLPWHATTGLFWFYQSGQPYNLESVLPYRSLTGSTSDFIRNAEPAGSRRTPGHHQLDLNYTQSIPLTRGINLQLVANVFNVFDKQTGYNFEDRIGTLGFINVTQRPDVAVVAIPDSIPDSVLKPILSPNAPFNRADWAVAAPHASTNYNPRSFQLAARIQF